MESTRFLLSEVVNGTEAFTSAHGKDLFPLLEERPESAYAFTKCMKGFIGTGMTAVAAEYDFSRHHTLLDLGGGMGVATVKILNVHKDLKPKSKLSKAIVFDLEKVVTHADQVHPILSFASGSFFDLSTIPTGADVIFINNVLHDWNDEECHAILSNANKVLEPGGRIIIVDLAVPIDPTDPLLFVATRLDVFMMTISTGHFRTVNEYNELWGPSGLKLVEFRPVRNIFSIWILEKI